MGMDFNLAEDEWAKEDNEELNKLLTKEEIRIEILEKQMGVLAQENEQLRKNLTENQSDCEMCNFPKLYKRCFELLKILLQDCYSIAECEDTNLGFWEDDLESAEQFIKENS